MPFSSSKIEAPEITGSLFGTASWAISSSLAVSASHALMADTASFSIVSIQSITSSVTNDVVFQARNNGTNIPAGTPVYISSSNGSNIIVERAQALDQTQTIDLKSELAGVTQTAINGGGSGTVVAFGQVSGINMSAYNAGDKIWVSKTIGELTNVAPTAPYDRTFVGIVTKNTTQGELFVNPSQPIHFHDISSVSSSIYNPGDLWVYQASASTGIWTNKKTLSGSYQITGSLNVGTGGITGSLLGTASFAVSASWAPSNGGASQGVAYQTAESGTLFDVTKSYPGLGPAQTRSIGGALQPGDVNVLIQEFPGTSQTESLQLVYKTSTRATRSISMGGTGFPTSRIEGNSWMQLMTFDLIQFGTYLPAAISSSVETAALGNSYHSSSAPSGALYYDAARGQYRVFKGLNQGGWQDLVTGGGGGNLQSVTTAGNSTTSSVLIFSSFAQGTEVTASGNFSHAEGSATLAVQQFSHAEGRETTTIGFGSHAEGFQTTATSTGNYAHAEGQSSKAAGNYSHAEGFLTTTIGESSHAEGTGTTAIGSYSHAEGSGTRAIGDWSHAEGNSTTAIGQYSHAEGQNTRAIGANSHAEGQQSWASGSYSHCEGVNTTAAGTHSHTLGFTTIAVGNYSNAEGNSTVARGPYSHAEGLDTVALGTGSHAEGDQTTASGSWSHAGGKWTIAGGNHQTVYGMFNQISDTSGSFIIGAGTSNGVRRNVFFASGSVVQVTGSLLIQSGSSITGSGEAVSNAGDIFTSTAKVTKMVTCTSAEYTAITTKDANTFYIII
jgi:hypothetical protein